LGVIGSDFEKQMVADTPLGRLGQPDDIAKVALFLASDDSGWLTGERLQASGRLNPPGLGPSMKRSRIGERNAGAS